MPSVLITRPAAASQALAESLQAHGYEAVIEPLLAIVTVPTPRPIEKTEAVMITSGNAFEALGARQIDDLLTLPCYCVGPRTAEKARAFGFRDVAATASDGVELARFIARARPGKSAPLLHICGRDVESKGAEELRKEGWRVVSWPVYMATPVPRFTPATKARLENKRLDAVAVFSPRSAQVLKTLLAESALEACCAGLAAICLSDAVAAELTPLPWRHLVAARAPTEDAVIACLEELCPVRT
jgi:uroporphyrinogen-III synthase